MDGSVWSMMTSYKENWLNGCLKVWEIGVWKEVGDEEEGGEVVVYGGNILASDN